MGNIKINIQNINNYETWNKHDKNVIKMKIENKIE